MVPSAPSSTMSVNVPPTSTPTRYVVIAKSEQHRNQGQTTFLNGSRSAKNVVCPCFWQWVVALDLWHFAPAARRADFRPLPRSRRLVDFSVADDDAVIGFGFLGREKLVAHVLKNGSGIALERIAPAAGAGEHVAEHLAALDHHGELGRQRAILAIGTQIV